MSSGIPWLFPTQKNTQSSPKLSLPNPEEPLAAERLFGRRWAWHPGCTFLLVWGLGLDVVRESFPRGAFSAFALFPKSSSALFLLDRMAQNKETTNSGGSLHFHLIVLAFWLVVFTFNFVGRKVMWVAPRVRGSASCFSEGT